MSELLNKLNPDTEAWLNEQGLYTTEETNDLIMFNVSHVTADFNLAFFQKVEDNTPLRFIQAINGHVVFRKVGV